MIRVLICGASTIFGRHLLNKLNDISNTKQRYFIVGIDSIDYEISKNNHDYLIKQLDKHIIMGIDKDEDWERLFKNFNYFEMIFICQVKYSFLHQVFSRNTVDFFNFQKGLKVIIPPVNMNIKEFKNWLDSCMIL